MSTDHNPAREAVTHKTSSLDFSERSAAQQLFGSLFGFDFFISYAWSDGRDYAVELAAKLEREIEGKRYSCFLDSEDYAKGDDWKQAGEQALRHTSILVLVGSPKTLQSQPVLREVQIYAETKRRIIPIEFVDEAGQSTLDPARYPSPIHAHLPPEMLRIREPHQYRPDMPQQLAGPSDEVVKQLTESFDLITQADKRARAFGAAAVVFAVVAILAVFFWQSSEANRRQAQRNEQTAIQNAKEANRHLADANWTLAFTERDQFHDSISAAWHFQRAAEASQKAQLPTHAKSALLAVQGILDSRATFSHGGIPVVGTRLSQDEARVLTWSLDGTVRLWDAAQDTPLRTWKREDLVRGAVFSRDESRVLTWSKDGTARLWDPAQDTPLRTWKHEEWVYGAVFSRDESRVLTWSQDGTARLWDAAQDTPLRTWKHEDVVRCGCSAGTSRAC